MKYRKKPVVIEAMLFNEETKNYLANFVRCNCSYGRDENGASIMGIQTLEGVMTANVGDYIIKGVKGEFYPCKPDIFLMTYDTLVDEEQ